MQINFDKFPVPKANEDCYTELKHGERRQQPSQGQLLVRINILKQRIQDSKSLFCILAEREYVLGLVCSEYLVGSVHHVDPRGLPGNDAAKQSSSVPQCQMQQGRTEPWEPIE